MARIALACLMEPGSAGIADQVAELGPEDVLARVLASPAGHLARPGPVGPEDVPAMLDAMARQAVRVVVAGDPEFPTQLADLPEPPLALWVRGPLDLRVTALRSVAIVGARACTPYGERATAGLAGGLAESGWAVVSGAAFGIDAAAHRAALAAEGPTVAVLACGIDRTYPRAHDALLCRIADSGAVVSELPPGSAPLKHRFLARNRLIAALSRGTLVVEAARRSGAIATANRALELGRVVMAVPGPITSMASSGTNRLLHERTARAVCDAAEVAALLLEGDGSVDLGSGALPGSAAPARAGQLPLTGLADADLALRLAGLPAEALAVHRALAPRAGREVQDVARLAGLPEAACLALLGLLEIAGLARRTPSGWRRCG